MHTSMARVTIPTTARGEPQGWETSRIPHFPEMRFTVGGEVVSVTHLPPFHPRFLIIIYVTSWVDPRVRAMLDVHIRSNEKFNDLIGNRTSNLPACSIIAQPRTLSRASTVSIGLHFFSMSPYKAWTRNSCYNPCTIFKATPLYILLHILIYPCTA
jgi:hypothetical protein